MTGLAEPRRCAPGRCSRTRGFSIIELAVSLVVIGLLASAAAAYSGLFKSGNKLSVDAQLASLSEGVMAFARTRQRLPCPDTAGTGYEALVANACPPGIAVGWLPYLSIGLSQPPAPQRAIYGVYRNPLADLAASATLTSLGSAAVQAAANTFVYVTGDGTIANGAEDCTSNVVSNPAYVILAPGEDRNGNGLPVDGLHSALPGIGLCFAAPTRRVDTNFDDRTLAVSAYAVMAKLNQ